MTALIDDDRAMYVPDPKNLKEYRHHMVATPVASVRITLADGTEIEHRGGYYRTSSNTLSGPEGLRAPGWTEWELHGKA